MSLRIFWKQAHCSAGNKIRIFDAVVKSRLLYVLQTLEIPDAQMSRLEAFHYKGLRQILRMETTFMNRANTNNEVLRRANLATRSRNNRVQNKRDPQIPENCFDWTYFAPRSWSPLAEREF